jgi:pyridoxamine 5'-phosphate oxidase
VLTFDDCVRFANEHMICSLATCDGDQPRVRMLGMWFADKTGFYFSTTNKKKLYRELTATPKAEVCFYAWPKGRLGHEGTSDIGKMLRASGDVAFLDDPDLKQRLLNERPFLRPNAKKQVIFRIQNGEARFWTSEDSEHESAIEPAHF